MLLYKIKSIEKINTFFILRQPPIFLPIHLRRSLSGMSCMEKKIGCPPSFCIEKIGCPPSFCIEKIGCSPSFCIEKIRLFSFLLQEIIHGDPWVSLSLFFFARLLSIDFGHTIIDGFLACDLYAICNN